jgi:hypothetical protein
MFNEWGNLPLDIANEIFKLEREHFLKLKPYLDKMTILEVQAFESNANLSGLFAEYILIRQVKARKSGQMLP